MSTRRFVQSLVRDAAERLAGIEAGDPRLEAEHLMAAALGVDRKGYLALGDEDPLDDRMPARFEVLLTRRLSRVPLQYVLGTAAFCELDFEVGPGVLIPRSETEVLVERVHAWAAGEGAIDDLVSTRPSRAAVSTAPFRTSLPTDLSRAPWLVDVGTGSGAILLTLLHRLPAWRGLGVDVSGDALSYARRNRDRVLGRGALREGERPDRTMLRAGSSGEREHLDRTAVGPGSPRGGGHPGRAAFVRGNLLDPIAPRGRDDRPRIRIVVSNPPYIPSGELGDLAPEIRDHEPRSALDGGPDGLDRVREICEAAGEVLEPGGLLALELAVEQPERITNHLAGLGGFTRIEIYRDLTGRTRGVLARKA